MEVRTKISVKVVLTAHLLILVREVILQVLCRLGVLLQLCIIIPSSTDLDQSAGAVEYTDCISAEG